MSRDILREARERLAESEAESAEIRESALYDIRFARLAQQWPDDIAAQRKREGRPCLVVNRLPTFIRQVVNDARQNKPSIQVLAVDGDADYDTAQVIGGLIRAIERQSQATIAYDTAIEHAVTCGMGFFRITSDYAGPDSFDMELRIERVANPLSVYWDTASTAFDASDWDYAFVVSTLAKASFRARYPKAAAVDFDADEAAATSEDASAMRVRVAEYWERVEKRRRMVRLTDGRVMRADELDAPYALDVGITVPLRDALAVQGIVVNSEREATYYSVIRRVLSGADVLEETEWPGSTIPIVPVWGEEVMHGGKRYFRSLVRDAIGPQQMLNFWRSAETELVALAPRAPWLVPLGAIPPHEADKWKTANTRSHAYLEYDPNAGPMPQRIPFAGVPAGALQAALTAADDIKSVTGIYDASLGARGNETTGRAILARQRQSDQSTFHFLDNLARAIEYAGRCLIEAIPAFYGPRQTIRILGEDEMPRVVRVTQEQGTMPTAANPEGRIYNLSVGRYDVAVRVGPSYATQREQSAQAMMELIRVYPPAAPVLGDLLVKAMDWPGADEAARRIQMLQRMEMQRAGFVPPPQPGVPAVAGAPSAPAPVPGAPQMPSAPQPLDAATLQAAMSAMQAT